MNDPNLPPDQWRPLFDKVGVEFGYRTLAARTGMTHTRVRRLLLGGGTTEAAVQEIADAFGVTPEKVHELRGDPAGVHRPFTLPDDAGRLTDTERNVIRSMVRALLDAREHGYEDKGAQTAAEVATTGGSVGVRTSTTRAGIKTGTVVGTITPPKAGFFTDGSGGDAEFPDPSPAAVAEDVKPSGRDAGDE